MSLLSRSDPEEELKEENKGESCAETLEISKDHGSEVGLDQGASSTSISTITTSLGGSLLRSDQFLPIANSFNNTRNNDNIVRDKKPPPSLGYSSEIASFYPSAMKSLPNNTGSISHPPFSINKNLPIFPQKSSHHQSSVDAIQTGSDSKPSLGNNSNTLRSSSSAATSEGGIPMNQHMSTNKTLISMISNSNIIGPSLSDPTPGPLEPKRLQKFDRASSNLTFIEGSTPAENKGTSSSSNTTGPTVLTCTSLGSGDSKIAKRAENAVLKLYKLSSLTTKNPDTCNGTLILPTKDQIVKGLADIELQIKRLNQQRHQLVIKIEEQKHQREEEEERKKLEEKTKKEEQERISKEMKLQQLREQEVRQKTKDETLKNLQLELEGLLKKKQQQFEQQRELQEAELENIWGPKVENKLKALRKAKHTVQKAKMYLSNMRYDLSLLKDKSKGEGEEEETAVKDDDAGVEEEDSVNIPIVLSSVTEENRKRAQKAHWNCISACLPLPHETTNGNSGIKPILMLYEETNVPEGIRSKPCEDKSSQVAIIDNDGEEQESLKPVTNQQWTALTRRIMSPADALYVSPTESLYWEYHEQRHHVLKDLILDQVRSKKRTLYQYWEALATDYIALQTKWKKRKTILANKNSFNGTESGEPFIAQQNNHPGDDDRLHGESGSHDSQIPETTNKRNSISAANMATLQATFRRNRRPLRGANSSTSAFIRGLGDVVRSEYEQELIIKELTEKEAMEKRIKHGGCSLPRQVSALERELFVSYQVDFAPRKIVDLKNEEQNLKHINPWTDMEKCIFFDRFLLFPKDFKKIASFLRNKTTMDCVAFYYDAKKSLPFKGALREHLLRKKRGRTADNCNISWMATIQAAISAGASVSEGDGSEERPFTFSIPGGDNTYSTSKFHPMQRDILDLASDSVTASCRSDSINLSEKGPSFISDDLNLKLVSSKAQSTVTAVRRYHENDDSVVVDDENACNTSYDAAVGTKKRQFTPEVQVSGTGNQLVRTSLFENAHEGNALTEAESSTEVTQETEQLHVLKSSTVAGAGSRKGAHKWAPEEKRIFFETLQQHGNDWPALVAAIGNKTLQQVKNFYYDSNKKQAIRNQYTRSYSRHSSDGLGGIRDASISPHEMEEIKVEISNGNQSGENFTKKFHPMDPVPENSTTNGNDSQQKAGLNSQILRESQLGGPAGIGTISGLHGQFNVERVGQNAHHDFLSNLNIHPWAAAAQQLAIHQSRDPSLRMREAWALEASLRQHQQQFQQMAYTLGGQAPGSHFPHDILGHIRASAGYTSPVPFVNTPPSEAQQAALMALTQMSVARNLAAAARRMASRSGESSSLARPPDQRANPASFSGPFQRDKEFGHDSFSK